MVKLFVLALAVCAATLAGSYAQRNLAPIAKESAGYGAQGDDGTAVALTETELLAFPVISEGEIEGFFFLRLAYAIKPASGYSAVPGDLLVADSFHMFAANHPAYRQQGPGQIDIEGVTKGVEAAVNTLAGAPMIREIYLTQYDYFASADVRKKSIERRLVLQEPAAKKAPMPNPHAAPAH
jgi:hypothetical protein